MNYKNENTKHISFPLGGVGSGSIGLAGNGSLVDWEIFNKPNRESINPFSGFAIKAEDDNNVIDFRMLNGDIYKDFNGNLSGNHSWGYGHGPNRGSCVGLKNFENINFNGEYPVATIDFDDNEFPGDVQLQAFNPFIPLDDFNSSLPTAIFNYKIKNTTEKTLKYTIALNVSNPFKAPFGKNKYIKSANFNGIQINSGIKLKNAKNYGNITIATNNEDFAYQEYWYRGGWFDNLTMFINDFGAFGKIKNRTYNSTSKLNPDVCTLTATVKINPNEEKTINFTINWYVPNVYKSWAINAVPTKLPVWKTYYATQFNSSIDVCNYVYNNLNNLQSKTTLFKDTLNTSSLPECVLDAIQGNIAILKSTTCMRLQGGEFWAFEGVNKKSGSCEGQCMHVWNYAYALPFLFPKLERGIRDYELKYNLEKNGLLRFRTMVPLGNTKFPIRACVDGQMGTIMKIYREWKISGDTKWLRSHWEEIQKVIEYAWNTSNKDKWDINKTGVIHGRQHNTLDIELFGVNSWLSGFYLGALQAGSKIAVAVGDYQKYLEYSDMFKKGQKEIEKSFDNILKYYVQLIDVNKDKLLQEFGNSRSLNMKGTYWDKETNQIKYQIEKGCEIDQVVADWHTELMGLDKIFDTNNRTKALNSIYNNNFISVRNINNPCRIFACNGEKGVLMCSYPKNVTKPKISVPYTEEFMSGFEYAVADNMLQCDMEDKALEIVSAIRDRYDGNKRNPWAEIECGASYSRAMASYSFLLTYSGFKYDMSQNLMGFKPKKYGKYFWSLNSAWGEVTLNGHCITVKILYGHIKLNHFVHYLCEIKSVTINNLPIDFKNNNDIVDFNQDINTDDVLILTK